MVPLLDLSDKAEVYRHKVNEVLTSKYTLGYDRWNEEFLNKLNEARLRLCKRTGLPYHVKAPIPARRRPLAWDEPRYIVEKPEIQRARTRSTHRSTTPHRTADQ
jgi:hypothetical protein